WRAEIDGAGIGRAGIRRTLTQQLGQSSLVASSRLPGANMRPPAGRDFVGVSIVTWSSRHLICGNRPVPPLAGGPPSASIRPTSEVAPMIATRALRLGVSRVKEADLGLRCLSIFQSRSGKR